MEFQMTKVSSNVAFYILYYIFYIYHFYPYSVIWARCAD